MFSWFSSSPSPVKATTTTSNTESSIAVTTVEKTSEVTDTVKEDRLTFDPTPDDKPFLDLFKKQHGLHWGPSEIDFKLDKGHYNKLPDDLRSLFDKILAFFASADSIVLENTIKHFRNNAELQSIEFLYDEQAYFEIIHVMTYNEAIDTYLTDLDKRMKIKKSFKTDPLVYKREQWMCNRMNDKVSETERLVSFICAEGINFVSSFLVIFYFRTTGRFPSFATANQWIARDELMIHVETGL